MYIPAQWKKEMSMTPGANNKSAAVINSGCSLTVFEALCDLVAVEEPVGDPEGANFYPAKKKKKKKRKKRISHVRSRSWTRRKK
jgi:hypothetical protein